MNIIAYTYEADYHCVDCTVKRYKAHGFYDRHGKQSRSNYGGQVDWHGVHVYIHDSEGNLVHPLFSTDEWQEFDEGFIEENPTQYLTCGDCHEVIEEYTHESRG